MFRTIPKRPDSQSESAGNVGGEAGISGFLRVETYRTQIPISTIVSVHSRVHPIAQRTKNLTSAAEEGA